MHKEDAIEKFIRQNRDKFGDYTPDENHYDRFMSRLNKRIRHFINIVPYLIRVSIVTVIIFIASIIVWNNFIRKDRHEITLKNKMTSIIIRIKNHPVN